MPSLIGNIADKVSFGSDCTIETQLSDGTWLTLGEVYDLDYDTDENHQKIEPLGTRITAVRKGRFAVSGSFKAYWINQAVRSMVAGATPSGSGVTSSVYASSHPMQRYNIRINSSLSAAPDVILWNVSFAKDAIKWTNTALVDETVSFVAEDVLGE